MIYKINIEGNTINLFYDDVNNWLYFMDINNFNLTFNVINPYNYNTDSYIKYNYIIIEKLELYKDKKRDLLEKYIKKCIENKNFVSCLFGGLSFIIQETNLNIGDYKIV